MEVVTWRQGWALVCRLAGELDLSSADQVRRAVDGAMARHGVSDLVLDLSEVSFLDSSGVGVILGRYRRTRESGGRMVLVAPPERLRPVLELAGILQLVPAAASVGEATGLLTVGARS